MVRLEAEAAQAHGQMIGLRTHAREIGEQAEGALEAGMVGVGLIASKRHFSEGVDIGELIVGTAGEFELSHCASARQAPGREPGCRPCWRC